MSHKTDTTASRHRPGTKISSRAFPKSSPRSATERPHHDITPSLHRQRRRPPGRHRDGPGARFAVLHPRHRSWRCSTPRSSTSPCRRSATQPDSADEATLSWIISGYALAYGLALIPAGRIGDRIGHKWVFFVGLAGFTAGEPRGGPRARHRDADRRPRRAGPVGGIFFPPVTAFIQLMFPPRVRGQGVRDLRRRRSDVSTALGPMVGGLLIQGSATLTAGARSSSSTCRSEWSRVVAAFLLLPGREPSRKATLGDWTSSASCCWRAVSSPSCSAHPGPAGRLAAVDLPLDRGRRRADRALRALGALGARGAATSRWCRRTCSRTRRSPAA